MRANRRRPAPSLVAIALVLIATAVAALAVAASGDRVPAGSARDRADGDPAAAHVMVVESASGSDVG
jgi:hypothetical protein